MMKSVTYGALAVGGVALLLFALPVAPSRAVADRGGRGWEPAESVGWADPEEARRFRDLDAECRGARGRNQDKATLTEALVRGERTMEDVAAQFRKLNAGAPCPYAVLQDRFPSAGEAELSYRQVVLFVRGMAPHRAGAGAALPALEAEVARRFPPATDVPAV
jgi:hypothetical protein